MIGWICGIGALTKHSLLCWPWPHHPIAQFQCFGIILSESLTCPVGWTRSPPSTHALVIGSNAFCVSMTFRYDSSASMTSRRVCLPSCCPQIANPHDKPTKPNQPGGALGARPMGDRYSGVPSIRAFRACPVCTFGFGAPIRFAEC